MLGIKGNIFLHIQVCRTAITILNIHLIVMGMKGKYIESSTYSQLEFRKELKKVKQRNTPKRSIIV